MDKTEYIEALRRELQALPQAEREEAVKYYSDYFDDAGPDKAAEVIAELGPPKELARNILRNFPCVPQTRPGTEGGFARRGGDSSAKAREVSRERAGGGFDGARVLLLVLLAVITFPIWGSLVAAVGSVLFALFVAVLAAGAGLVVAAALVLLGGVLLVVLGVCAMFGAPLSGLLLSGTGLLLSGAGIICVIAGAWLCGKIIPAVVRGVVRLCRMPFAGKGGAA